MSELNREQIIKALENWVKNFDGNALDFTILCNALSLIKELTEEKKNLEYTLAGVMHSVDKWLDGKELEQDEVNRAATMREKTLQIVERLTEENERLRGFNSAKCEDCAGCTADKCDCANIEADTVRKMQEKLIKDAFCKACGIDYSHHIIQIAKEMLEDTE